MLFLICFLAIKIHHTLILGGYRRHSSILAFLSYRPVGIDILREEILGYDFSANLLSLLDTLIGCI
jgi:hypothetical protein